MFLRDKAPEILEEVRRDLALATVRCSCDYLAELEAFDQILLRMRLGAIAQNRLTMLFDYFRLHPDGSEELVARGEQQIACMRRENGKTVPTPIPASLREALRPYEA
jgi:enediyne biosynthesis thioesterase